MPEILINDVPIEFPYPTPYGVQRMYMEKVIECLKNGKNGALESPTGTGKTLSLLCSSLAWLKQQKYNAEAIQVSMVSDHSDSQNEQESSTLLHDLNSVESSVKIPKIIYASRTHTQLTQVIKELKETSYNNVKVGLYASRFQLCIHPDLKSEDNATRTEMCKSKTKMRLDPESKTFGYDCSYFSKYKDLQGNEKFAAKNFDDKILDIEDLRRSGEEHHYCPYFMSKTLVEHADIVFMPYNYLLDPKIRHFIDIELDDAVVILDEAHNVPQVCEDSASIEFSSSQMAAALLEIKTISDFVNDDHNNHKFTPTTFDLSELNVLVEIVRNFLKGIDEIPLVKTKCSSLYAAEFEGDFIFTIMDKADIGYHTSVNIRLLITNILEYVAHCVDLFRSKEKTSSQVILPTKSPGLRKFNNILWTTFAECGEDFREEIKTHYRVYVVGENSHVVGASKPKIVNYWCFSPKFGLQYLIKRKHVRSIIFTSGTISPLQPFITSLGIEIDVRLQNGHIIDRSQVLVEIISHGPDNEQLISNFDNRDKVNYLRSLGQTILKLAPVIPNGLLVFFPSYGILEKCKSYWQNHHIWGQIERVKKIFVESKENEQFLNTMTNYYERINDSTTTGAIFMAVCRGKVSEGLDFADANGRAVIITGLPFAPIYDPKVRLKKSYMQKMQNNCTRRNEALSGDQWYQLEASRAVNQAIGRVIRHRHDYGAILFCDSRFNKVDQKRNLSQWVQRHIRSDRLNGSFDTITNSVTEFFRTNQKKPSSPLNEPSRLPEEPAEINQISPTDECIEEDAILKEFFDSVEMDELIGKSIISTTSAVIESPNTSFARQFASLLHSPAISPASSSSSVPASPRANVSTGNGTPSKQRCTVNLSQRFDGCGN